MENNDSNTKPQQTGGLKLMTVFIAVLALHVIVIGGFTVYHLMSGGGTDTDLAGVDKTHKSTDGTSIADGSLPATSQGDKGTPAPTPPTEVATIPANPSASDVATTTVTPTPASSTVAEPAQQAPAPAPTPAPVPALTLSAPKPVALPPSPVVADQGPQTPTGPISSELAPPPDSAPLSLTAAPIQPAPVAAGPVHMPPTASVEPVHEHQQIYLVKITDSYKKIAHTHHITVAQLKEANHIKGNVLHTGQKLIIPSEHTLVAENDTTSAPALVSTAAESTDNDSVPVATTALATSTEPVRSSSSHHLYTVVKGDTLTKIAHKFKTTTAALMTENSITDPTKLAIGKKLKIPSRESRSARNNPPASTQPSQVQAKENAPSAQLANFVP